jgi:hypothetical protein
LSIIAKQKVLLFTIGQQCSVSAAVLTLGRTPRETALYPDNTRGWQQQTELRGSVCCFAGSYKSKLTGVNLIIQSSSYCKISGCPSLNNGYKFEIRRGITVPSTFTCFFFQQMSKIRNSVLTLWFSILLRVYYKS